MEINKKIIAGTNAFIFILNLLYFVVNAQPSGKINKTATNIDSLKNTEEVVMLIHKINPDYHFQPLNRQTDLRNFCKQIIDSIKAPEWIKADIDQNGLNDIVITGRWNILLILDLGNSYRLESISTNNYNCVTTDVFKNKIRYHVYDKFKHGAEKSSKPDTYYLVYKFGGLINEEAKPSKHRISKITYSTSACFGKCPVFIIQIDAEHKASFNAIAHNQVNSLTLEGNYTAAITTNEYEQLTGLLNYMNFEQLPNNYLPELKDAQQATLSIEYANGKIKTITDKGLKGTASLEHFHRLIHDLRVNQDWKKTD